MSLNGKTSDRKLASHTTGRACFLCCRFGRGKTHLEIAVLQQRAAWVAEAAAPSFELRQGKAMVLLLGKKRLGKENVGSKNVQKKLCNKG